MQKITKVIIEGRTFHILKDEQGYWGIEDKYIKDGKLTRRLDPLEDNLRDNLAECINAVEIRVRIDMLVAGGMSEEAAAMEVLFG